MSIAGVHSLHRNGMEDLAEQILAFQVGPDRPVDAFLKILRDPIAEPDPIPEAKAHAPPGALR